MATKTTTHTAETVDTATIKVTCNCTACNGKAATVRTAYANEHKLTAATKTASTHVHNLVQMAHGPLRFAPQVKANGPWAA